MTTSELEYRSNERLLSPIWTMLHFIFNKMSVIVNVVDIVL